METVEVAKLLLNAGAGFSAQGERGGLCSICSDSNKEYIEPYHRQGQRIYVTEKECERR